MSDTKKSLFTLPLRIIPLGGLGEVGKNCWILTQGDDWIIIDAGMAFPFNEYPGVELIFPPIDYLINNKDKLKALIITHAHEDHIGGAARILSSITIPRVIGSNLTISLLEKRFEDLKLSHPPVFIKVKPRERVNIDNFQIEFIRSTHSVPDCFALLITSPQSKILLSGDFKFDFTPVDSEYFDIPRLIEARNNGIDLLISDSTNVERPGFSLSEKSVGPHLVNIFNKAPKRIFITTFSSHIHRIQQIIDAAIMVNRKICFVGYSMEIFTKIARETGYLKYSDDQILDLEEALKLPLEQILIITTGSQGEMYSTLAKLARKEHKTLKIIPGDTIIFSAYPIPGNERCVSKLQDELCALGADIVYGRSSNVHVSGHGCREELKLMLALTKPEYFLPAHGDYRMLVQHAEVAASMGIDPAKIFILENGDALEIKENKYDIIKNYIDANPVYLDSMAGGIVDSKTLKDRMLIGEEGIIWLNILLDESSDSITSIDLACKGITYMNNNIEESFVEEIKTNLETTFNRMKKFGTADINNLRTISRDIILKLSETKLGCKPLLMVFIQNSTVKENCNR